MSSRHGTVNSRRDTPSENEIDGNNNQSENNYENCQDRTSVEPNTTPTETIQGNPLQVPKTSYFDMFTEEAQNPSLGLKQHL